jgi:hypothetical protein
MKNKERYNQIIDKVFKKYGDSHWTPPENPNGPLLLDQLWSVKPMQHSKEGFIQACKTDKEFSEKWGLKIEERELSLDERNELLNKVLNRNHKRKDCFSDKEFETETLKDANAFNIPTKLITVTYNNETIEIYD